MGAAVILAVMASFCTATSSVCQRIGARSVPVRRFGPGLLLRLARQPIWVAGVASMILGFGFQFAALRHGDLALVQPILAAELLFVFAYMGVMASGKVHRRDWLAAAAMAAGLGVFLFVAAPHGGRVHSSPLQWWLAGVSALGLAVILAGAAYVRIGRGTTPSPARRAALLGVATGVSWGFVAAIIKVLAAHRSGGVAGLLDSWSLYALIVIGAASMVLASHALQAGPLAASQPGFTIADPLIASLLGVFIFNEHIHLAAADVAMEAAALAVMAAGVLVLSGSKLVEVEAKGPEGDPVPYPTSVPDEPHRASASPSGVSTGRGSRHPQLP